MAKKKSIRKVLGKWYIYIVLILLWLFASAISPFFRTMSTFSNILVSAVPIALIGLAQTFVVLSGGFDLSVGMVASMATAIASVTLAQSILPAVVLVILIAFVIGLINGLGITKFNINPFIMTLSMMYLLTGINLIIRPSPGGIIPDSFKRFLLYQIGDFPLVPFCILILTAVVGIIVLQKRKFGREIYAVGGNLNNARMSGVNTDRIIIKVYIFSAIASALAGLFIAARISSGNAEAGAPYLFDSFTTVFMGGTLITGGVGGFSGTLAAALILSSIGRILQFLGITIWYHFIVKGFLLASVAGLQIYIEKKKKKRT